MNTQSEKAASFNENFKTRTNRQHAFSFAACVHCGTCNDSCHYYLASGDPEMTPAAKMDKLRQVYKAQNDWLGKLLPGWVGAKEIETDEELEELKDIADKKKIKYHWNIGRDKLYAQLFGGAVA